MNDHRIEIKEQRKGIFAKGLSILALMIISLTVALFPYLSESAMKNALVFFIIGGIAFVVFTTVFVLILIKEYNPNNALILSSHGFIDLKNVGDDIEIEWTNIASVKMLGKGTMPFLGIVLENSDIVMARMKKVASDKMRKNIEDGLPAILISQKEVRIPIRDLRDIFIKFVRESRLLQKDAPKKTKTNPFTTEDVLRAFGKLPNEATVVKEDAHSEETTEEKVINSDNSSDAFYDTLYEMGVQSSQPVASIDDKTEDNRVFSNDEPVLIPENDDVSNDDVTEMPDELKEILSRARSSKISELEKILSESDVPYSLARNQSVNHKTEKTEQTPLDAQDSSAIERSDSEHRNLTEPDLSLPNEFYKKDEGENQDKDNDFEHNLDIMLSNAFKKTQKQGSDSESKQREENRFDPNAVYPELVLINDADFENDEPLSIKSDVSENSADFFDTGFITSIDDD